MKIFNRVFFIKLAEQRARQEADSVGIRPSLSSPPLICYVQTSRLPIEIITRTGYPGPNARNLHKRSRKIGDFYFSVPKARMSLPFRENRITASPSRCVNNGRRGIVKKTGSRFAESAARVVAPASRRGNKRNSGYNTARARARARVFFPPARNIE